MIVVAVIGLDFVVFQTLCLTRTEGVSPSIEAAVKPHFWYPMNLLSIFIGYSRLHVVAESLLVRRPTADLPRTESQHAGFSGVPDLGRGDDQRVGHQCQPPLHVLAVSGLDAAVRQRYAAGAFDAGLAGLSSRATLESLRRHAGYVLCGVFTVHPGQLVAVASSQDLTNCEFLVIRPAPYVGFAVKSVRRSHRNYRTAHALCLSGRRKV